MEDKNINDNNLKDNKGNYFHLEVSDLTMDVSNEDFIPDEIEYPDACRYIVYSPVTKDMMLMEDMGEKQIVVSELKRIHGIVDPWDNDPEYFVKKIIERDRRLSQEAEPYIRNTDGQYNLVEKIPEYASIKSDDVIPKDLRFPDACVYIILSEGKEVAIENLELKNMAVKILKEKHGIWDYWDDDPNLLHKKYRAKFEEELKNKD